MKELKSLRRLGLGIFGKKTKKWNTPKKYFVSERGKKFHDAQLKEDKFFRIYYSSKKQMLQIYPAKEYKPRKPFFYELTKEDVKRWLRKEEVKRQQRLKVEEVFKKQWERNRKKRLGF